MQSEKLRRVPLLVHYIVWNCSPLTTDQFTKATVGEKPACTLKELVLGPGVLRLKNCGIKFIRREPVQNPLVDLYLLDVRLKFYRMYENLLFIRPECDRKRMFLQINRGRTRPEECFKRQHLGKGFFDLAVKTICFRSWCHRIWSQQLLDQSWSTVIYDFASR